MPNTYSQIQVHFVFAVKYRQALINPAWKEELNKYITGIFQYNQHRILQINSMPDHIHIFAGLRPHQSISGLIQNVKTGSTQWIREKGYCASPFAWQEGYGAFSYARSQVNTVVRYIQNQEIHHRKETFLDEYRRTLNVFEIDWDEKYLFTTPI